MYQGNDHNVLTNCQLSMFTLTHREEEILKQHREVSNALRIKIDSLEQEKENVKEVTR